MSIKLNLEDHDVPEATVRVDEFHLYGKLVDLPCIIESTKVVNEINLYKMADISQMLICQKKPFTKDDKQNPKTKGNSQRANNNNINKEENKASKYPHGLAPPLKNARRRRLRKILKNKEEVEQAAEIEKEVFWLLRADNEAVRFFEFDMLLLIFVFLRSVPVSKSITRMTQNQNPLMVFMNSFKINYTLIFI